MPVVVSNGQERSRNMVYQDSVYGKIEISSPVLLDLMQSQAMVRLHGVLQHGITALIGLTLPITRFEHSVGAMLLVQRLGGDEKEQIAALLHDVSHTAFSHVIDHAIGDANRQSYHDEHKERYVKTTDLPQVLARHDYDWRDFLDETKYTILEQDSPRLCADRVDYFLRDAVPLGVLDSAEIAYMLAHLTLYNNRIVVNDLHAARLFGYRFMHADDKSWANWREVGLYELAARAIRRAMEIGVFTEDDMWGIDQPVWEKMLRSDDVQLRQVMGSISAETRFLWDEKNSDIRVRTKLRAIDPDVLLDGKLAPLSTRDPAFATTRTAYFTRKSRPWPMRTVAASFAM